MTYSQALYLAREMARAGIVGLPAQLLDDKACQKIALAMDAAPSLSLTAPSNGIPDVLRAYISPETIRILTTPTTAEEIFGPVKYGTFGCGTAMFKILELTGFIAEYGDYSEEGDSNYNPSFPTRDEYRFQTMSQFGDLESGVMSMAGINSSMEVQEASARTIKKGHNRFWFYGVAGLKNYGILNDPNLPAPIAPVPDGSGTIVWSGKNATAISNDVRLLVTALIKQSGDNIKKTDPLKLCLSTDSDSELDKVNDHNVSVRDTLKKTYPNMEIVVSGEYDTAAGQLVQCIAPRVDNQVTAVLGYSELIHAHGMVRQTSSTKEKKSAGTFGTVYQQPFAVAQILGV